MSDWPFRDHLPLALADRIEALRRLYPDRVLTRAGAALALGLSERELAAYLARNPARPAPEEAA